MTIIEQITKFQKLLSAIPRMENFISKILLALSMTEDPIGLDKAIPTLYEWKRLIIEDVMSLQDFKCQVGMILKGVPISSQEVSNIELISRLQSIITESPDP